MLSEKKKPMWQRRISVIENIYRYLLTDSDENNYEDNDDWTSFEHAIFSDFLENKQKYLDIIKSFLRSDWEVTRINPTTVSIMLEAISEFNSLKTPKNVLISQSVKTTKNYCDNKESKFVNGILESIFNNF